jgi:tRNA nucleotidyltransferase (CCA-adding enzyme)
MNQQKQKHKHKHKRKGPMRTLTLAILFQNSAVAWISPLSRQQRKQQNQSTPFCSITRLSLSSSSKPLDDVETTPIKPTTTTTTTTSKGKSKANAKEAKANATPETRIEEPCNVVFTHTNADFDTLAAAVALSLLWTKEKPEHPTHVVLPRGVHPVVQRFLAFHKHLLPLRGFKTILPEDVHAIGVVDAQSADRIGRGKSWLDTARSIHVFDHHDQDHPETTVPEKNKKKATNSLVDMATEVVIDSVGSTTTLLVERLRDAGIKPKPHEATLFVLGIRADTGGLVYESTTIRDASALLWCLENGASQVAVGEFAISRIGEDQRNILNLALQKTKTDTVRGLRLSTVLVGDEEGEDNEYVAGLAQVCEELLDLTDSHVFVLGATHQSGKGGSKDKAQWVSLIGRASPRAVGVNLSKIMRTFGGGGHPKAAAAAVRCESGGTEDLSSAGILASAMQMVASQIPEQLVASSFMVPLEELITISTEESVATARQIFDDKNLKSAPVVDPNTGQFRGSLKLNDLVKAIRSGRSEDKVRGIMRSNVTTILPDTPLADLEELLVEKGVGRLPVVDDEGALVGLVTRTDVLRQHNLYDAT